MPGDSGNMRLGYARCGASCRRPRRLAAVLGACVEGPEAEQAERNEEGPEDGRNIGDGQVEAWRDRALGGRHLRHPSATGPESLLRTSRWSYRITWTCIANCKPAGRGPHEPRDWRPDLRRQRRSTGAGVWRHGAGSRGVRSVGKSVVRRFARSLIRGSCRRPVVRVRSGLIEELCIYIPRYL